jgi:hypothetical protein
MGHEVAKVGGAFKSIQEWDSEVSIFYQGTARENGAEKLQPTTDGVRVVVSQLAVSIHPRDPDGELGQPRLYVRIGGNNRASEQQGGFCVFA